MNKPTPAPVDHYENFPVASWLCPPRLRPPIAAIYHFARTADDLADEGEASADQRLDDLAAYRADLLATAQGLPVSTRWPQVFGPLATQLQAFDLPVSLLDDLLDAFAQDVRKTRDGQGYADRAELLDYCRRSANPVGRLLLHLYGVQDDLAVRESDAICSALQLINFWQDISRDVPRGRHYLNDADCAAHGVTRADIHALRPTPALLALLAQQVRWARELMREGAPLVHRVPGRAGWELRFVVQGGLRILDRIEALGHNTLQHRPTVGAADAPRLLWRALRM
ncbi:MAG: squalene synthase HpnC [Hylemonella sp.]|uniref:squalene synthase HpnC n=1 Tax=Hylemonella sp. TaxID=2066020 RepID=UPI0022C55C20|nr:squalene synthase HpnC [Hylemonella sp.]MCZ8251874.1 squalene synthase HpnC [Hylemonella sp.]